MDQPQDGAALPRSFADAALLGSLLDAVDDGGGILS
jgi:hypothetical protein